MKNYYEILEVDRNDSEEVIEKAYKTLVKKYHPDLQNINKNPNKMQQINEAYEILSNDFKRRLYDEKFQEESVSIEEYKKIIQENNRLKNDLKNVSQTGNKTENRNTRQFEKSFIKRYYDQLKGTNTQQTKKYEKKKIEWTPEKIKKILIFFLIVVIIITVLAIIPFTRKIFVNIYNNVPLIKVFVDAIIATVSVGF